MSGKVPLYSQFTTKQLYVIVAIGIIISASCFVFSYAAKDKLKSDDLTAEERSKQILIQSFSTIGFMVGVIVALVPSVFIFQQGIQKKIP